jgi:hypothetical protein
MNFRLIPEAEKSPQLIASCKRPVGRWVLVAAFTVLSSLLTSNWLTLGVFLGLATALPGYRRSVLSAAGILIAVAHPNWLDLGFVGRLAAQQGLAHLPDVFICLVVAGAFGLLAALAALVFRVPRRLSRHPVMAAIISVFLLITAASLAPLIGWSRVAIWILALAITRMLWFFCYTLSDRDSRNRDSVPLQAGLWRPAWMMAAIGSGTTIGKGAAYLRRIEARNAEELALTQIKGFNLLLWTLVLKTGQAVLSWLVYSQLRIPDFDAAFARSVSGHPFAWYWNCLSLVSAFLMSLLTMSVWGHQIVACLRMAGFRALRNTYRPLEARTLAEFWNRYDYYFKELLVDMFFYPTYLRYFKKYPRLRMAFATMAAACAGNAIYHFLSDISFVAEIGWWRAIAGFQTYLFYCLALGTGITISQLRGKRKDDPALSWFRRRLVPILCVAGFYCSLYVFDDLGRTYGLREHFVFVGRMLGL